MSNDNKKRLQLSFTKPGHALTIVISMVCVIMILLHFAPDHLTIAFLRSVHLLALSMLNGVAFWVTFVGGLTMFRTLPRVWFSEVQSYLFQQYFFIEMVSICLVMMTRYSIGFDSTYEIGLPCFSMALLLLNAFYCSPIIISLQEKRFKIENDLGLDTPNQIAADADLKPLAENEQYQLLWSKFRKMHGLSSVANLLFFLSNITYACVVA